MMIFMFWEVRAFTLDPKQRVDSVLPCLLVLGNVYITPVSNLEGFTQNLFQYKLVY